jgi:hypothetical protein
MGQGIKFFSENIAEQPRGGTVTVSSNDSLKWFSFDNLKDTRWISTGEGTDGNAVSMERDFGSAYTIDSIFVYNTNISDIAYDYWNGSSWVAINSGNATITKSSDNKYVSIKMNSSVTTERIRITGSNTITANQEKEIGLVLAFSEIGQLEYRPTPEVRYQLNQILHKIDSGGYFIIDKGESFLCNLNMVSHVNQNDIDICEELSTRKRPFFMWICGGDTSQFTYKFRPYRFQDIFKMGVVDSLNPNLTRNYYKAGYNNTIQMVELA